MASKHNPKTATHRQNRIFIGSSLAVLVCPAPNGKQFAVTIDREDASRVLAAGFWRVCNFSSGRGFSLYCYTYRDGRTALLLHRFLTNAPAGIQVDHAHHRTLDNRKCGLRFANQFQQSRNTRIRRDSKTGFRGVSRYGPNSYRARLWVDGKHRQHIGFFPTAEAAAKAYDEAARTHHGEFASLNFPEVTA